MIFGIGAAGNKAAIEAIEEGKIAEERVKLVNTTTKDIPEKYKIGKDMIVQFSSSLGGGCGKEPDKGYEAMVDAIQNEKIDFYSMVPEDVNEIVLVTSTEGGTGCGATPVLVQYFNQMDIPVHVFALIGFQDEIRGVDNTLKFFQRIGDNVILHTIMNDQFLDYTGSYSKAEEAANKEFAHQLEIIIGSKTIPSEQNIDDTDRYKATTTTGYMDIKTIDMAPIKNKDQFNDAVIKVFDNSKCLRYDAACKRLSIIVNADDYAQEYIDDTYSVIKRYTGEPVETFRHVQNDGGPDKYVDIMVSGIPFPERGIREISDHYKAIKAKMNKEQKSMNDIFSDLDIDDTDEFNMGVKTRKRPTKMSFNSLGGSKKPVNNTVTIKNAKDNDGLSEY